MIYFYSGTPGSGKSLSCARDIFNKLTIRKQAVISNININTDYISKNGKRKIGEFIYLDNTKIEPQFFYDYAYKNHKKGVEGQTLIIFDEAQMLFSPTVVKLKTQEDKNFRVKWLEFFTQHRHLGYNIIMISQFDKLIDPQIRCLFEYNVIHRKLNNFKFAWILSMFHIKAFIQVNYWYGVKEKCGHSFFIFRKKYSKIYDSYKLYDEIKAKQQSIDSEVQKQIS